MIVSFLIMVLYLAIGWYLLAKDMCSSRYDIMLKGVREEVSPISDEEFNRIIRLMKFYAILFWPWLIYDTAFHPDVEYNEWLDKEEEKLKEERIDETLDE